MIWWWWQYAEDDGGHSCWLGGLEERARYIQRDAHPPRLPQYTPHKNTELHLEQQ